MPKGVKGFQKGHPSFLNEEIYKKISEKNKGQRRTEETKNKIKEANKNNRTGIINGVKTRFKTTGVKGHELLGINGYRNLHKWVVKTLGQPEICSKCGKSGLIGRQIHWANKSGRYKKDKNDWIRLCVKCHFHKDKI